MTGRNIRLVLLATLAFLAGSCGGKEDRQGEFIARLKAICSRHTLAPDERFKSQLADLDGEMGRTLFDKLESDEHRERFLKGLDALPEAHAGECLRLIPTGCEDHGILVSWVERARPGTTHHMPSLFRWDGTRAPTERTKRPQHKDAGLAAHLRLLRSPAEEDREKAAAALADLGSVDPSAAPALIVALKDKNGSVRSRAAEALGKVSPAARQAVPALLEVLRDRSALVQTAAAKALLAIDRPTAARQAVPALIDVLKGSDSYLARGDAADVLAELGTAASDAIPALVQAANGADGHFPTEWEKRGGHAEACDKAIQALEKVDSGLVRSVPDLAESLGDNRILVRRLAAEALGKLGPLAKNAVPALKKALTDGEPAVRQAAEHALKRIQPGGD